MNERNRYRYISLGDDDIRLIRFLRDDSDCTFAELRAFSLHDELPSYCALSYTWKSDDVGEPTEGHIIEVEGQSLPVLGSVQSFIQALRARDVLLDRTWWWIDSICIDQGNLDERSKQVNLMQQIYLLAHECIVWLGPGSDDSDEAIDLIRALGDFSLHGPNEEAVRTKLESTFCNHQKQWAALSKWFMRKWWTRIWTIQEFVIPRHVALWCGRQTLSRTVVCRALMAADRCPWSGFKATPGFLYGFNRRRLWMLYRLSNKSSGKNVTFSLAALAAYFSVSEATDDRDRLYGLRALSTDAALLQVSYEHSYQEVYLRYAQASINHYKSLDIICFASVYTSTPASADNPSPSWVPDWRRHMSGLVLPLMVSQGSKSHIGNMRPAAHRDCHGEPAMYAASGLREAIYSFEGRTLHARGVMIDCIDGLTESSNSQLEQCSSAKNSPAAESLESADKSTKLLRSICKALCLDRKNRYVQYAMPESFFRDFMRLCFLRMTNSLSSTASDFQKWFDRVRLLNIHGHTFEARVRAAFHELGVETMDNSESPPSQAEYLQDSFFGRFMDTVTRMSMRLTISCDGQIGLAPEHAKKGDMLCILYGCSVPVVLRRSGGADTNCFTVVGECFIDGFMEGQGVEHVSAEDERVFRIV